MKVREEELLARLRALGSRTRAGASRGVSGDELVRMLGLPERELTPGVRTVLRRLVEEVSILRHELAGTQSRLADLERLADEDALAPISNRRAFLRDLGRNIGYIERYGVACSLLYLDLNGLKSINDSFGHAAGDAALIHVAGVLLSNTRRSDVVGRLGGDEFGVLLARADEPAAENKGSQLAASIAGSALRWEATTIPVSVAYGVHRLSPGEDPQSALAAADRAMYRRKQSGNRA